MPRPARPLLLPLLAFTVVLALGGLRLGLAPLGLEEVTWTRSAAPALARLPSLLPAALAAALVAATAAAQGLGWAGLLAAALSPALLGVAREAGPCGLAALCLASSAWLVRNPGARARFGATLLASLGLLLAALGRERPALEGLPVRAALGLWGALFGATIPPWRLDIAVPLGLALAALGWLGAGSHARERAPRVALLLGAAALLGMAAPRSGAAPLRAAALAPLVALAAARGIQRLPAWLPRALPLGIALAAGWVGAANLALGRDRLDPAQAVPWDQAAGLLAVLAEGDSVVLARPGLPAPLRRAAQAGNWRLASVDASIAELEPHARVLALSWGITGGLGSATAAFEERLSLGRHRLAGELLLGPIDARLARLAGLAGVGTTASHYLRVRRYERAPEPPPREPGDR